MQPYYRLMKSILFVLFLSFGMISCEKEDPVSTSPTTRQTDDSTTDPTDPDPTDPVVRSNNEQTVFMYLPWSNNLTSFFYQNIADLKSIIGNNILKNERVIVFICTSATKATLSELVYENGKSVQKTLKNYDYTGSYLYNRRGHHFYFERCTNLCSRQTICNDYRMSRNGMDTCIESSFTQQLAD